MRQQIITDYPSLTAALATERKARGYSQLAFDDHVGLAEGHTAKIEAGYRSLGPMTLPMVLLALGCVLVLAPVKSIVHHRPAPQSQLALPIELPTRSQIRQGTTPIRTDRRKRKVKS